MKSHWENVYDGKDIRRLGWYQDKSIKTMELIQELNLSKDARIFIAGAGSTLLVDDLYRDGYTNLIVNDLSAHALENIKKRLPDADIEYIEDSITSDSLATRLEKVDLWQDRALLHFLTAETDQKKYVENMKSILKNEGYAIIAVFNLDGAKKCSGLDVKNYSASMIADLLGSDFELLTSFDHMYVNPSGGERPYVYTLFRKLA